LSFSRVGPGRNCHNYSANRKLDQMRKGMAKAMPFLSQNQAQKNRMSLIVLVHYYVERR
jgi:hypothetical protein